MNTKEFNLSDCIDEFEARGDENSEKFILVEDVKEFIRLLKKEIGKEAINPVWYKKTIDKLAGESLVEEKS